MKTTILIVRHGQSEGNTAGVFSGHSGFPLTALGHEQAERTAEFIKRNYHVDAVYSSDLPRAFQTAEHTARAFGLSVTTCACFREINAGCWECKSYDDLPNLFPRDYGNWLADVGNARCTGGESVMEVADRVFDGIVAIARAHEGQCVMIATHATPLRVALWKAAGIPCSAMQQVSWGSNCAISELEYDDGKLTAIQVNYTEHLAGCETFLPANV